MHKKPTTSYFSFCCKKSLKDTFCLTKEDSFQNHYIPNEIQTRGSIRQIGCWMYCTTRFSLVLKALYSILKSWPSWRARKLTNNYRSIAWDNEGFLQMAFNTQIWLNVQARNKCYQMCWTECSILTKWYSYDFDFERCNCHFHRNFI